MNYRAAKSFILRALDGLPPTLPYHGKHHTRDVFQAAKSLCKAEKTTVYETRLILTAALLHDCGFLRSYQDHEQHGCDLAREWLPQFGYTEGEILAICGMITATKIPQSPQNRLEAILCDADLDYLGRSDFEEIADTLFKEMNLNGQPMSEAGWTHLQIHFLHNHTYFTRTNQAHRSPQKAVYLAQLEKIAANFS